MCQKPSSNTEDDTVTRRSSESSRTELPAGELPKERAVNTKKAPAAVEETTSPIPVPLELQDEIFSLAASSGSQFIPHLALVARHVNAQ